MYKMYIEKNEDCIETILDKGNISKTGFFNYIRFYELINDYKLLLLTKQSRNFIMRRCNKIRDVIEKDDELVEELSQPIEFVLNGKNQTFQFYPETPMEVEER